MWLRNAVYAPSGLILVGWNVLMLCVTSWGTLGSDTAWRRSNPDSTSQWWAFFGVCTGSPFWILWTSAYSTSTSESALEDQFQDSFSLAMDLPWHVLVYDTQNTSTPWRGFPHPFNSHQRTETFSYATRQTVIKVRELGPSSSRLTISRITQILNLQLKAAKGKKSCLLQWATF